MHVLYVDDSGSVANADERFFVLGGVSVFERGIFHLMKDTDECIASFGLGDHHDIELHGNHMYHGRGTPWDSMRDRKSRELLLHKSIELLAQPRASVKLFAVAIDKGAVSPRDPIEMAFEEICNRFNLFLQRMNDRMNQNNRGLIVMDETKHEKPLQRLAKQFRINGGRFGHFRYLAEVPLFVDSKATRIIQLADLVAWSTWRKYEHSDGRFFDPLVPIFDADGGVIHGLYHARGTSLPDCFCPACHSRNQRDRYRNTDRPVSPSHARTDFTSPGSIE